MRATASRTVANRENPEPQTPRSGLTTAPHSFIALWGHSAVRVYGQTYIPKVAQFCSGDWRGFALMLINAILLIGRLPTQGSGCPAAAHSIVDIDVPRELDSKVNTVTNAILATLAADFARPINGVVCLVAALVTERRGLEPDTNR
jgi:hypothetical protein